MRGEAWVVRGRKYKTSKGEPSPRPSPIGWESESVFARLFFASRLKVVGSSRHGFKNFNERFQQRGHFGQGNHVGSVAGRLIGMRMGFDEDAIGAGGEGAAGEDGSELALAARFVAATAGQLHGV